jgi:hypothetical protein
MAHDGRVSNGLLSRNSCCRRAKARPKLRGYACRMDACLCLAFRNKKYFMTKLPTLFIGQQFPTAKFCNNSKRLVI